MKKILLSLAVITALGANAQNPTNLVEEMDGTTPCHTGFQPAGNFTGYNGNDFTGGVFNVTDGSFDFEATTNAEKHSPLYYPLSAGNAEECSPFVGKGLVDITGSSSKLVIRAKSTSDVSINVYIQEGNAPSWDYSKFSETALIINLTPTYQEFELSNISLTTLAGGTIDLTSIGTIAFELGSNDIEGTKVYDQVSGATVSIDYIRLVDAVSINEAVVNALNVYPNPATEQLNVVFDATSVSTVELTDLTGKVVATQSANAGANAISFNVANVNAGVYFVNIKNAGGNSAQKVIIK